MVLLKRIGGFGRIAAGLVVGLALTVRLWSVLTHTYVVFFDETFQYLEQGHRLAFGSGVVPWEYIEGIRSWLLPGVLAVAMRLAALGSEQPGTLVLAVRVGCIALSLTVPYVGFRLAGRRHGVRAGVATGLLCAVWYELVYYAPVVLAEVLATHVALWAIWLGDAPGDGQTGGDEGGRRAAFRRLVAAGALFGLAVVLRYQYAPALALAALWQHGRDRRRWRPVGFAALVVVAAGSGGLDWATWGSPFQSIWLNFRLNAVEGVAASLATQPWYFLPSYVLAAWGPLFPLLAALALLGAADAPALAVAAFATVVLHSLTPHKEVRFIYLALAVAPVLVGLGLGRVLERLKRRPRAAWAAACGLPLLAAAYEAAWADRNAAAPDAWRYGRDVVQVFEAAHDQPGLCGVGVRSMPVYYSGGYTYLHSGVPMVFEAAGEQARSAAAALRLHFDVIADGRSVPQHPASRFPDHAGAFNVLIAARGDGLPGYRRLACFGTPAPDDPEMCLFRRPGDCSP